MPKAKVMKIAVDFDGTIVAHEFPEIGAPVPGALDTLRWLRENGHELYLWTMRSGETLQAAVDWLAGNGITFHAVNQNPTQHTWTASPKLYAQIYIDDAALGCPLRENPKMGGRPYVDWDAVRRILEVRNAET